MSIKRRINQLEKIAGRQGELTPEQMAERCRYIEERLYRHTIAELGQSNLCDDGEDAEDE